MDTSKISNGFVKRAGLITTAVALSAMSLTAAADRKPVGTENRGKPDGIACQQAGIKTLQSLGLLSAVAKNGIEVEGIGVFDFQTVLSLHRTMPELFDGGPGSVSVIIPGVGAVPADWCK